MAFPPVLPKFIFVPLFAAYKVAPPPVDFIVPLEQEKMDYTPPSQLVKIENEEFIFLRK